MSKTKGEMLYLTEWKGDVGGEEGEGEEGKKLIKEGRHRHASTEGEMDSCCSAQRQDTFDSYSTGVHTRGLSSLQRQGWTNTRDAQCPTTPPPRPKRTTIQWLNCTLT